MQSLNRSLPRLTRAQAAILNPVTFSSERARVVRVLGDGLTQDRDGLDLITVSILTAEKPGQPFRLTAKDTLATQLESIAKENQSFAFEANVSGNPIPYFYATSIEVL